MDVRNYRLVYGRVLCEAAVFGAGLLRMPDDFVEAFDALPRFAGVETSVRTDEDENRVWIFGKEIHRVRGGPNVLSVSDLALAKPSLDQEADVRDMLAHLPMAILACEWLRPVGIHVV